MSPVWLIALRAAAAWDDIGATWPEMPISYYIAADLGSLEDPATIEAIRAGFTSWGEVECAAARFAYLGRTTDTFPTTDGQNTVSFVRADWPADPALPTSEILTVGGGAIFEADLALNTGDHDWSVDGDGSAAFDVQSGVTHLVGRLLGFRASLDPEASTNPALAGDPEGQTLADDDLEALCTTYPAEDPTGSVGLGGSCDDHADCAAPYRCVADAGEQYCAPVCPGGLCPQDYVCYDAGDPAVCTRLGCGCATGVPRTGGLMLALLLGIRVRGVRARGASAGA